MCHVWQMFLHPCHFHQSEVFREFGKRMAHVTPLGFTTIQDSDLESDTASLIGQCVPVRRAKADPSFWRDGGIWDMWPRRDSAGPRRALPVDDITAEIGSHALGSRASAACPSRLLTAQDAFTLAVSPLTFGLDCETELWDHENVEIFTLTPYRLDANRSGKIWSTLHLILCKNRPLREIHLTDMTIGQSMFRDR